MEEGTVMLVEERRCSAKDLRMVLMHRYPIHYMSFVDLFALGCLLHYQGERSAGQKLVCQVIDKVSNPGHREQFDYLLKSLSGNEIRFLTEIGPDTEVRHLCERTTRNDVREAACAR
jgi:hypothetical protein